MATVAEQRGGAISRHRFMVWTIGFISATISLAYLGTIVRYLYPKNAGNTPPMKAKLTPGGVIDPHSGGLHRFENGVAGPLMYPMTEDSSVVVGVFVEKKDPSGPLTAQNLLIAEQTCTHLGCPVNWVPGDNKYELPLPRQPVPARPVRGARPRLAAADAPRVRPGGGDADHRQARPGGVAMRAPVPRRSRLVPRRGIRERQV